MTSSRFSFRRHRRFPLAVLLCCALAALPAAAFAATFRSSDAPPPVGGVGNWDTTSDATRGWSNVGTAQPGNRDQPTAGANVTLDAGSTACTLDLGSGALNNIAGLNVESNGWGITGANTLTANQTTLNSVAGGTFTVSGGATLTNLTNTSILAGTFHVVDATVNGGSANIIVDNSAGFGATLNLAGSTTESVLTGNNLTIRNGGSYVDDAKSTVDLTGAAHFNNSATINSESFSANNLTVGAGQTLSVGDGANVTSRGDSTLAGNIALGAGTLNGANITFNGTYSDTASSVVNLSGDAAFNPAEYTVINSGAFSAGGKVSFGTGVINSQPTSGGAAGFQSNGLYAGGNLYIGSGAYASYGGLAGTGRADVDFTLHLYGDSRLDGGDLYVGRSNAVGNRDLIMDAGSALHAGNIDVRGDVNLSAGGNTLAGRNLTVGGIFSDDLTSAVNLSGLASFTDHTIINSDNFNSVGLTTAPGKSLGLGDGAVVDAGFGNSLGDIIIGGNLDLANYSGLNGATLKGSDLSVAGAYYDRLDSTVNLSGKAYFNDHTIINSGDFNSVGLETAPGKGLGLGDGAVVDAGYGVNGNITIGGNLDLKNYSGLNGATLKGNKLSVAGAYYDRLDSTVNLSGLASFADNTTINSGSFTSVGLETDALKSLALGAGANVNAGAGDITVGNNLDLRAGNNTLAGRNLTVDGTYYDVASSTVDLTGVAEFRGTVAPHVITGDFSSVGMTVGQDALVNVTAANPFSLGGGPLTLESGTGVVGSGPNNGKTTLEASGKHLDVSTLNMGDNTALAAGSIHATGDVNLTHTAPVPPAVNPNTLTVAGNLRVDGKYTDSADSTVTLGSVTFNGKGTVPGDINVINGAFATGDMTVGSGSIVDAAGAQAFTPGGDLVLQSGTGGMPGAGLTVLNAAGKDLALKSVTLGDNSSLTARDITTTTATGGSGNVDLTAGVNGNTLNARNLTVAGTYKDGPGSAVTVTDTTVFKGGKISAAGGHNVIQGSLSTTDMIIEGDSKVAASNALALNINGELVLQDGSAVGPDALTTLDASGKNLQNLTALRMGDSSLLLAGNVAVSGNVDLAHGNTLNENFLAAAGLTVGGVYKDAEGSIADIGGRAVFNGTQDADTGLTAAHVIRGNFSARGMTVGSDAGVDVLNTGTLHLTGHPLVLEDGSGPAVPGPGPGPYNGVTTLNAPGQTLRLDTLQMGNNSELKAARVATLGLLDMTYGTAPRSVTDNMTNTNRLDAASLDVGSFKSADNSTVNVTGDALFYGLAQIAGNFTAGGISTFYGGTDALPSTITGPFNSGGMTVGNGTTGAVVQVADFTAPNFSLNNGPLTIRAHSQLRGSGSLDLGTSHVDIDLNRDPAVAAIQVNGAGNTLTLNNNPLTLRHSGTVAQNGDWLVAETENPNGVIGGFANPTIATASLTGQLVQDADSVIFSGSYTPLPTPGPAPSPVNNFVSTLKPNARRAYPAFADMFNNRRTPFMYTVDAAYTSQAALQADLSKNLEGMTAESAMNQAGHTHRLHNTVAVSALGYAFGKDAPISAQSFVPSIQSSFQEANAVSRQGNSPRQALAMAGRPERAGNRDLLMATPPPMAPGYSVIDAWQPAVAESGRRFVAQASPASLQAAAVGGGLDAGSIVPGVKIWGGYVGDFAGQQADSGYSGYNAQYNGFLVGASVDINQVWTVGAYGGWSSGSTSSTDGVKAEIDSGTTHLGAFGRYRDPGGAMVTADVAYTSVSNDSDRSVDLAGGRQHMKGSYGQQVIGFGLEAAYNWVPEAAPGASVTPFAAMRYSHLSQDGYTESGPLALKVKSIQSDAFNTTLGVRAAYDIPLGEQAVLTPKATAGWLHNWADDYTSARSSFVGSPVTFETRSVQSDRDAAQLGLGLDLRVKPGNGGWDFGLKTAYGVDLRAKSTDQTLYGGLEVRF